VVQRPLPPSLLRPLPRNVPAEEAIVVDVVQVVEVIEEIEETEVVVVEPVIDHAIAKRVVTLQDMESMAPVVLLDEDVLVRIANLMMTVTANLDMLNMKSKLTMAGELIPEPPNGLMNRLEKLLPKLREKKKVQKLPRMARKANLLNKNKRSRVLTAILLNKPRSDFNSVGLLKLARPTKERARSGKKARNLFDQKMIRTSLLALVVRKAVRESRKRKQ